MSTDNQNQVWKVAARAIFFALFLFALFSLSGCQTGGTYHHGVFVRDIPENAIASRPACIARKQGDTYVEC